MGHVLSWGASVAPGGVVERIPEASSHFLALGGLRRTALPDPESEALDPGDAVLPASDLMGTH
eukprot:6649634-Pyramimonas_sp.AAC.1